MVADLRRGLDDFRPRSVVQIRWLEDLVVAVVTILAVAPGFAAAGTQDSAVGQEQSRRVVEAPLPHVGQLGPATRLGVPQLGVQHGAGGVVGAHSLAPAAAGSRLSTF